MRPADAILATLPPLLSATADRALGWCPMVRINNTGLLRNIFDVVGKCPVVSLVQMALQRAGAPCRTLLHVLHALSAVSRPFSRALLRFVALTGFDLQMLSMESELDTALSHISADGRGSVAGHSCCKAGCARSLLTVEQSLSTRDIRPARRCRYDTRSHRHQPRFLGPYERARRDRTATRSDTPVLRVSADFLPHRIIPLSCRPLPFLLLAGDYCTSV